MFLECIVGTCRCQSGFAMKYLIIGWFDVFISKIIRKVLLLAIKPWVASKRNLVCEMKPIKNPFLNKLDPFRFS